MARRILALCLVLCLCAALTCTAGAQEWTWTDPVHQTATDFVVALNSQEDQFTYTEYGGVAEEMLYRLFTTYPMLAHYYKSAQWLTYEDRVEMTIFLKNHGDSMDDIWMVDSDEDLLAAIGLGLARVMPSIRFITYNGYIPTEEAIEEAVEYLHYEHYLSYMGYHGYGTSYIDLEEEGIRDYEMTFPYFYDLDPATIVQWRAETQQAAQMILSTLVAQDMPEYRKALVIHDWLVNNSRYNIDNMDEAGNHLAYGPMVRGWSVCMGYAEAALMLLKAAGMEAYYIAGDGIGRDGTPEAHAWNAVRVDGQWYLMDATWDDPVSDDGTQYLYHNYFLVTDTKLSEDHIWDRTGLPYCDGIAWNADLALAAYEADTNTYYDYNTSKLITVEQALMEFEERIVTAREIYEATVDANYIPVETQAATEPVFIAPAETESLFETEEPFPTTEYFTNPTEPRPQQEEKGGFGGIVLILALAGAAVFLVIRLKDSFGGSSRRPPSYSGPSNPFGSSSSGSRPASPGYRNPLSNNKPSGGSSNPFGSSGGSSNPFGSSGKSGRNPWDP